MTHIESIVAQYAHKTVNGPEVDLKRLANDEDFQKEVISRVGKIVEKTRACVLIPAYNPGANENHLGQLINELALSIQVKTIATGDAKNIQRLRVKPKEVMIIKQSFRAGQGLKNQIAMLKELGVEKVSVLCFITHNTGRMQGFGVENGVEIDALVKTDEIRYLE